MAPAPPGVRPRWITGAAVALAGLAAVVAAGLVFGGGSAELVPRWRLQTGSAVVGSPRVEGGDLVVATRAGSVVSVDAGSGRARWRFETGERVGAPPVVAGGLVYVSTEIPGTSEGTVFAVDARTGAEQWRFPTTPAPARAPAAGGGLVVIGTGDAGDIVALDGASGEVRWRRAVPGVVALSAGPGVVVAATSEGLRVLDAATGGPRWSLATTPAPEAPVAVAGDLVVADNGGALVAGLGTGDGSPQWQLPLDGDVLRPPAVAGNVAVVITAGDLVALDLRSGELRWQDEGGDGVEAATDGALVARTGGGHLILLDAATGQDRGQAAIGDDVAAPPAVAGGRAYVASGDTVTAYDQPPP